MELSVLIDKIKREKGVDLSGYKESTLQRRLQRRMHAERVNHLSDYIARIDADTQMYDDLLSDFYIGVTDFFRDPECFSVIREKILPSIIQKRLAQYPYHYTDEPYKPEQHAEMPLSLRIWSAGCSTGEEVYSLAMILRDIYDAQEIKGIPTFIHGTDIHEEKIACAKRGFYTGDKISTMDHSLTRKYFREVVSKDASRVRLIHRQHYSVAPSLRIMTRFYCNDLVSPSGLYGFDMIVCRNVLIYLGRELQERILSFFYHALRKDGILWLGKSECVSGGSERYFSPLYKQERIYQKK